MSSLELNWRNDMPNPIVPIHKQNDHDELFNIEVDGLSSIQQQLLGPRVAAKKTYSARTMDMLERIYKSVDPVLSQANNMLNRTAEVNDIFNVPSNIDDYELLGLKTEGLIVGGGRSVKLTEAGRIALRDHWLKSQNDKKINKESPRFDYANALEKFHATKSNTVTRVAEACTKGRFKKSG